MDTLLGSQSQWLWTIVLGLALFFPVRQLIWVWSVRHQERKSGEPTDDARKALLKRRATVTALLLCFIVSVIYSQVVFNRIYVPQ